MDLDANGRATMRARMTPFKRENCIGAEILFVGWLTRAIDEIERLEEHNKDLNRRFARYQRAWRDECTKREQLQRICKDGVCTIDKVMEEYERIEKERAGLKARIHELEAGIGKAMSALPAVPAAGIMMGDIGDTV